MKVRKLLASSVVAGVVLSCLACSADNPWQNMSSDNDPDHVEISLPEMTETEPAAETTAETAPAEVQAEPNGETYILFTSDVHCGIDTGFGYAGLYQIRHDLEAQGYNTVLVDNGDAIQGDIIGSVDEGETIVEIMNEMDYDAAIPGTHEFDYGTDRFLELTELADYPYISCNFTYEGELLFEPYTIISCGGYDVAFVGITTPLTLDSQPSATFQNEDGEYVYGFCQSPGGEDLYAAVQNAVDAAREQGADLVYVMAHLGNEAEFEPYTYADVISNTTGIDVFLDGHSHDTDQVTMLNADDQQVVRSACGTRLNAIGYSHISADGEVLDTGIWRWDNNMSVSQLLGIDNEMSQFIESANEELSADLNTVIAHSDFDLTLFDPQEVDLSGERLRVNKISECNIGDFVADAFRIQCGTDIALINGGSIRCDIESGDITYGDVVRSLPYNNNICIIEASGRQILDALEWGAHKLPESFGGFLQVSGLTYEVDMSVSTGCITDENMQFCGIEEGPRRVSNVMIGGEPLDLDHIYTIAGTDYILTGRDNGFTMFDGCTVVNNSVMVDNQAMLGYIIDTLGGQIPEEYSDPYGQGRIVFTEN